MKRRERNRHRAGFEVCKVANVFGLEVMSENSVAQPALGLKHRHRMALLLQQQCRVKASNATADDADFHFNRAQ